MSPPAVAIRHDWTLPEVQTLFDPARSPLMELTFRAAQVHRQFHDATEVQVCKLISIKTGGCPEDCSYCSQSARYQTEIKAQPLMPRDEVLEIARAGYLSGTIDFFNLMDTERTLLNFELSAVEARTQREIVLSRLSLLIAGTPPAGTTLFSGSETNQTVSAKIPK